MWGASFMGVLGDVCAVLVIGLAGLTMLAPGFAAPLDARSETIAAAEGSRASVQDAEHDGGFDWSCHPGLDCSPAAILLWGPVSRTHVLVGKRGSLEIIAAGGRDAVVELPPPRTGAVPRSVILRHTQTREIM
ncbi:hypothetical protein GCM10011358_11230 [Sinisalibacter lacisalsi]|uniref:Uncharacterized protein n=1 Tax=Sinisalibacter lacisalsi TaxID=1526570 RepID=A0ABQ1QJN9_9RHOB|nr:hypothetical protein GCM10011358_11230 [Sinisalibacter lacisalsi]